MTITPKDADHLRALAEMAAKGSHLDLDAMRFLLKQRISIQSRHVEVLLGYVEQIQREARNKALEEAAAIADSRRSVLEVGTELSNKIRALKDKGE